MLELLETARVAALAGARALTASGCDARVPQRKSSDVDLVTPADVASGIAIVESLAAALPDASFVIEEAEVYDATGIDPGDLHGSEVWVIDPLDGTTSFVHDYPGYSVSVALLRAGRPVLGVVHDVPRDRTFAAATGLGATLDDEPVSVSNAHTLDEALLITGFPYDRGETLDRQLAVFSHVMRTVHGIRRDGSAALDLCQVAAGHADGFWEFGLSPWDTAAGLVILQEAGGVLSDVHGAAWRPDTGRGVVAANPILHERLLRTVQEHDPAQASQRDAS